MLLDKCFVNCFYHRSVSQLGCIHMIPTTPPTSTLGETSFSSQVLPKGLVVRVLLVHFPSVEPWVCPCANKASSQDGIVNLACHLIADKIVQKNHPTQVTGFVVDLTGKCSEGTKMNWAIYLINKLEKDCHEV
jgi:hypothetical protein